MENQVMEKDTEVHINKKELDVSNNRFKIIIITFSVLIFVIMLLIFMTMIYNINNGIMVYGYYGQNPQKYRNNILPFAVIAKKIAEGKYGKG